MRRCAILLLAVALAAGCRTAPRFPTDEERAAFGDVAVTVARPVNASIREPVTGWAAGLGMGTVRGLGATIAFAGYGAAAAGQGVGRDSGGFGVVVILTGAAVGAAVGIVYTPVSMIGGATTAPSGDAIDWASAVIRPLAEDPGIADRFSALFVADAQARAGRTFVDAASATTVVELRVVSITSGATMDWYTMDRAFEIRVEASARVVRRADGHVVFETTQRTGEPPGTNRARTYVEWAANDGEEFRREIDGALATLATGLAAAVFTERE